MENGKIELSTLNKQPFWKDILDVIIPAVIIYLIINLFVITSSVHQTSMYPTFKDGDFIVATRGFLSQNTYSKGDVILFKSDDGRILIKRVIGLPGDTVTIRDGQVYVNNKKLDEPYLETDTITEPEMVTVIHKDCYFVMGDNRYNSLDSRAFGEINVDRIIGQVRLRVFPDAATF